MDSLKSNADVVLCNEEKGVYRSNKIIIENPVLLTEKVVMDLYKKSNIPEKLIMMYCQFLQ